MRNKFIWASVFLLSVYALASTNRVIEATAVKNGASTFGIPATTNVSSTESGYLAGVTSAIQTQLNGKTSYTANQYGVVLSGSGNTMSVLAPDAHTNYVLTSGGLGANPSWLAVPAAGITFPATGNTFTTGAGAASPGANYNTAAGLNALDSISGGSGLNVAVGVNALNSLNTGSQNVAVGVNSCGLISTEQNNVCLGYGSSVSAGASNAFALGANSVAASSNVVAFGPALKQELGAVESGSPTAWLSLPAVTTSAHSAPLKIKAGTLMTSPEDGALEYDGTHLWFTIGGTRKQLDN